MRASGGGWGVGSTGWETWFPSGLVTVYCVSWGGLASWMYLQFLQLKDKMVVVDAIWGPWDSGVL